jgi:serine protease inhibitor
MTRSVLMFALISAAGACSAPAPAAPSAAPAVTPAAVSDAVVRSSRAFGFDLFGKLVAAGPKDNIFISPTSVAMCLTMAWNGASGTTQAAMATALRLTGQDIQQVNGSNAALLKELAAADPKVKLMVANSLWARKGITFQKPFLTANQQYFNAEVTALDFSDPSAPGTINAWVSANTNGLIKEIVSRINQSDILFLINAVYFKGNWTEQFDKSLTRERDFFLPGGPAARRQMMARDGKFSYLATSGFQAVNLPYGSGRLSMYLFVPDQKDGLPGFLKQLTAENWDKWLAGFGSKPGDVVLPRFKIEYEATLNQALSSLGMGEALQPGKADFTKMVESPFPIYISEVKHKTFVEVNEEGTEAAAVTSTRVAMTAMPRPGERFSIIADHPFFIAIADSKTGAILFMGAISDPKQ